MEGALRGREGGMIRVRRKRRISMLGVCAASEGGVNSLSLQKRPKEGYKNITPRRISTVINTNQHSIYFINIRQQTNVHDGKCSKVRRRNLMERFHTSETRTKTSKGFEAKR